MPLKVSVVDMIEIGAGGGSIARVEPASGLMKVGPRSAGAKPGPVCYGLGGTEPTVTDADLVLGRLNPDYFLGGEMHLELDRVRRAFEQGVARELKLPMLESALGVQRIVDETMAAATRMHLAEKGRDPRRYTLIAFGGAGPVHAYNLARLLKMRRVIVPLGAGVASALGFLVAPPATDMVRSYVARIERLDWDHGQRTVRRDGRRRPRLLSRGRRRSGRDRAAADRRHAPCRPGLRDPGAAAEPRARRRRSCGDPRGLLRQLSRALRPHRRGLADRGVELAARLRRARRRHPHRRQTAPAGAAGSADAARRGTREVLFEGAGALPCAVYDRYALAPGASFDGPALVEERESTCCVGPDAQVSVDAFLNLVVELP